MGEYRFLNAESQAFLDGGYLNGLTVDERVANIADHGSRILGNPEIGHKFKEYMKKGWYSLSTPMWTNFGTDRGLPISCFGSYVEDDMDSILSTASEVGKMTQKGGGTSGYFGALRPRGSKVRNNGTTSGPVHFMQLFNSLINIVSQGSTRRGNFAAYLPVEHPDIMEFLTIRDEGAPIQDLSFGVTITDAWMNQMIKGDSTKRKIWAKILESRSNKGFPYIVFIDNANNGAPGVYSKMPIVASNLCTEIMLPSNPDESFVCNLSSMNLLYYDEWKNTDAVEVLVYMLDAAMSEFIDKASMMAFMERTVRFATRHRAIGLGVLGWHSYLQSKLIPIESEDASDINRNVFSNIRSQAYQASHKLAKDYGEAPYTQGTGRRNTTLLAIAPTKSSSFILGQVSEGIEPHRANHYIKDLAKGKFTVKNKHLEALLEEKGKNDPKTWNSILRKSGSVQHLSFLTEHEKNVFKTFQEIDQNVLIEQAADRQVYIDQGQSLNVMIHPKTPAKEVSQLFIKAWEQGVKSLYYQLSVNAAQELSRNITNCDACEL